MEQLGYFKNILIIIESPGKIKKLSSILQSISYETRFEETPTNYEVIATLGHITEFDDDMNSICLDTEDIEHFADCRYKIISKKRSIVKKIKEKINSGYEVILACDRDREGEKICYEICKLCKLSIQDTKRIIFNEITETAIRVSLQNPQRINMNMVQSQEARQILDTVIGFTISPILWKQENITQQQKTKTRLSAGRCQSCVLKMVYDKYMSSSSVELESRTQFRITGYFTKMDIPFTLNKILVDIDEVEDFLHNSRNFNHTFIFSSNNNNENNENNENNKKDNHTCDNKKSKKETINQPEPLITSTLIQFSPFSPTKTMEYAQELYEGGHITYMRTNVKKYSIEFINCAVKWIMKNNHNDERFLNSAEKLKEITISSNLQEETEEIEAHEGIRPTDLDVEEPRGINTDVLRVYKIIRKISIQSCMSPSIYNVITTEIQAYDNLKFINECKTCLFMGFEAFDKKLGTTSSSSCVNEKDEDAYTFLNNISGYYGEKPLKINYSKIIADEIIPKTERHLTERELVKKMENYGIGRPSTYSIFIDKIQKRNYVIKTNIQGKEITTTQLFITYSSAFPEIEKRCLVKLVGEEKDKLLIQPVGILVIEFLNSNFSSIFDYNYTKKMEEGLDDILKGKITKKIFCMSFFKEFRCLVENTCENFQTNNILIGCQEEKLNTIPTEKLIGVYKEQNLYIKNGKYGIYFEYGNNNYKIIFDENNKFPENWEDWWNNDIDINEAMNYINNFNTKPTANEKGFIRKINETACVRSGKYGDYIYFKTKNMKTPKFFNLSTFEEDYKTCNVNILIEWLKRQIKNNYK